ncbi:MAG: glucose 1-dehydrogenase [Deltaproteobacteria bacterium]|nr:glucose 1-dehydrogenase [Deltaproteobacteria bacterium]
MARLEGKVALVTGAARGIGAAIASLFGAEGAAVVVSDRRDELGEAVAQGICREGGRAIYEHLDIASEDGWREAVGRARAEFGGVDVLINNAGIIRVKPFVETTLEELRKVIDTNLVGAFLGMQAVVETMTARGGGSIVNFSSVQGLEGREGLAAYTAAKFGIRGLTKTVAIELGPHGIRVNALFPGPTKTKMTERKGWTDEQYAAAYRGYPLGRMGEAEEIARLALFLASDEASFCTGGDFVADGGVTAGKPRG